MNTLLEYYRKIDDGEGNTTYSRVKEEDIKICGKTIEEVITILRGLELEKITEIEMTMKNLDLYIERFYQEQVEIRQKQFRGILSAAKSIAND